MGSPGGSGSAPWGKPARDWSVKRGGLGHEFGIPERVHEAKQPCDGRILIISKKTCSAKEGSRAGGHEFKKMVFAPQSSMEHSESVFSLTVGARVSPWSGQGSHPGK